MALRTLITNSNPSTLLQCRQREKIVRGMQAVQTTALATTTIPTFLRIERASRAPIVQRCSKNYGTNNNYQQYNQQNDSHNESFNQQ